MVFPAKACLKRHADICSGIDESTKVHATSKPRILRGVSLSSTRGPPCQTFPVAVRHLTVFESRRVATEARFSWKRTPSRHVDADRYARLTSGLEGCAWKWQSAISFPDCQARHFPIWTLLAPERETPRQGLKSTKSTSSNDCFLSYPNFNIFRHLNSKLKKNKVYID